MITLYHGTTSRHNVGKVLYPPSTTGTLREEFRKKYIDVVFLTNSLKSAQYYAKKAVEKYGGEPIIYEASPIPYYIQINTTEYICPRARIDRRIR